MYTIFTYMLDNLFPHSLKCSLSPLGCSICASQSQDPAVPGYQSLEDICDDFQGLSGVQTLSNPPSFYPTPSRQTTPQPLCNDAPNGGQLPLQATLPVAPCIPWPVGNPLYGMLLCVCSYCRCSQSLTTRVHTLLLLVTWM